MIICPKCKTANLEASKYCDKCGNPLAVNINAESLSVGEQDTNHPSEAADASCQAEAAAAEPTARSEQESEQKPAADNSNEETLGASGPAPIPASAKKQRASLFTEPNSILDRIQNKKTEKAPASVPDGMQALTNFSGSKPSKSAGEILNIAIAAITGIGVLWLCFYVLKHKFGSEK